MFEWYEEEVQALEHARKSAMPAGGSVVFYGSSSIRLWESLAADFAAVAPVNLGFGGSTLAACAHYFERLVAPYYPRSIVFYAGDNDLGDGLSPGDVLHSFRTLLAKVNHYIGPIPFAFISIKPSPARWPIIERVREANALVLRELLIRERAYYIDIVPSMLDEEGRPRPELFAEDGLHLSPEGYRVWKEVVAAYSDKIF